MIHKCPEGVPGFSGNPVKPRGFLFKFPENSRENFRASGKIFRRTQNFTPKICDHFFVKFSSNFEPFLGHFSPIFRKTPLGANFQYAKKSQKIAKNRKKLQKFLRNKKNYTICNFFCASLPEECEVKKCAFFRGFFLHFSTKFR